MSVSQTAYLGYCRIACAGFTHTPPPAAGAGAIFHARRTHTRDGARHQRVAWHTVHVRLQLVRDAARAQPQPVFGICKASFFTKQSEAQPASAALFCHTLPRMPRPTRSHAASACVIIVVIATLSLIQLAPRVPLLHQQTVSPFHLRAHRLPPLAQPLSRYSALPPARPPTYRIQCACFRALFRAQRRVIQLRINSFALREMLEIQNAAADAWAAYARTGCMQRVAAATAMHLTRFWRRHDRRRPSTDPRRRHRLPARARHTVRQPGYALRPGPSSAV